MCGGRGQHGGAAPQVKRKARERFNDLVDPAINALEKAVELTDEEKPTKLAITAAKDILDRAGYKPVEQIHDVTEETEKAAALREEFTLEDLREIREEVAKRKP